MAWTTYMAWSRGATQGALACRCVHTLQQCSALLQLRLSTALEELAAGGGGAAVATLAAALGLQRRRHGTSGGSTQRPACRSAGPVLTTVRPVRREPPSSSSSSGSGSLSAADSRAAVQQATTEAGAGHGVKAWTAAQPAWWLPFAGAPAVVLLRTLGRGIRVPV